MSGTDHLAILVRSNVDRFQHHALFAAELAAAFGRRGWKALVLDYIESSGDVFKALRDPNCRFFVTFNGFGTELQMPTIDPGRLEPAFQAFGRPVIDLMHDCPFHESMVHQLRSTYPARQLFITDYKYAEFAQQLGVSNVTFAPSITFPEAMASVDKPEKRDIEILLAGGMLSPSYTRDRFHRPGRKGRLYQFLFEEITDRCGRDWTLDPLAEIDRSLAELGVRLDGHDIDNRFLLTMILDYVKFDRRRRLLAALKDFPVTLVADRAIDGDELGPHTKVLEARSAKELLALMCRSSMVLCPAVHMTGFHERPLSAFSAGAAVVSAPNRVLQTHFQHGKEIVLFDNDQELRHGVERLLGDTDAAQRLGIAGRERAGQLFHPDRLVAAFLNTLRHIVQ